MSVVPDLAALASAHATAIQRRHALDAAAAAGGSVPTPLLHAAEAEIRAAEVALIRARAAEATVKPPRPARFVYLDWMGR